MESKVGALFRQAVASQRAGHTVEAQAAYRQVLAAEPDHGGALHNLGVLLRRAGQGQAALPLLARAAELDPDAPQPAITLGKALAAAGQHAQASACFGRAFALRPEADLLRAQAQALLAAGHADEAVAVCRKAAMAHPDNQAIHFYLAETLHDGNLLNEALAVYQAVLERNPGLVEAVANIGNVLIDLGRLTEAEPWLRRALVMDPTRAAIPSNLGTLLSMLGHHDEAEALLKHALTLRPENPSTTCNLAGLRLRLGDLSNGWQLYEARWRLPEMASQLPPLPRWQGEDPAGRTILLQAEQGLGDTLQFIRYAPLLARRGARVVVQCQPELAQLVAGIDGVAEVVVSGSTPPAADLYCPLMSLPHAFGTTLATIPATVPYLVPQPERVARWREWRRTVADDTQRLVGLVWAGGIRPDQPKAQAIDRRRSLTLNDFAPLSELAGIRFVSLQKGPPASQAIHPPPGLDLIDPMGQIHDFSDTAALIMNLDLVVAVDTAVPHLAGALGRPVWVLSRFDACWRWLWDRDDSPWYPTLRLFRQSSPRDWGPVMAQVVESLRQW